MSASSTRMSPSTRRISSVIGAAQPRGTLGHASSTGWMSVGELAMTPRISLVAVCCSNASQSVAFLSSLNSRTFSIAITAWSAKVSRSAICLSVNGRTSVRRMRNEADGRPSRSSGVARKSGCRSREPRPDSGNSVAWREGSGMWTVVDRASLASRGSAADRSA